MDPDIDRDEWFDQYREQDEPDTCATCGSFDGDKQDGWCHQCGEATEAHLVCDWWQPTNQPPEEG